MVFSIDFHERVQVFLKQTVYTSFPLSIKYQEPNTIILLNAQKLLFDYKKSYIVLLVTFLFKSHAMFFIQLL